MTTKWEYKVVFGYSSITLEFLNQLGEEGWELVFVVNVRETAYFKREKIKQGY